MPTPTRVAAIIPAKDEADRIAATVTAVRALAHVEVVVVVDDGSTDDTAAVAAAAGASVVRHPRNRGKSAAMASGAARVAELDATSDDAGDSGSPRALPFVDADHAIGPVNPATHEVQRRGGSVHITRCETRSQ